MKLFSKTLKQHIKKRMALYFMLYSFFMGWILAFLHIVTDPLFTFTGWLMVVLCCVGILFLWVGLFLWISGEYGKKEKQQQIHILPVKGCYGIARHPIFSGIVFTFCGFFILFTFSFLSVVYFLSLYIVVLFIIRSYEKNLIELHQLRFIYYKNCVPSVIPIPKSFPASYFYPVPSGWISNECLALQDRCVNLFLYRINQSYIAIDTGKNPRIVQEELKRYHISPSQIQSVFLTHIDRDHCGGLELFSNATIYVSSQEFSSKRFFWLPYRHWKRFTKHYSFRVLDDLQKITIETVSITSFLVPGHTPGHMNYVVNENALFTGDSVLFQNGRIRPFYSFLNWNHTKSVEYANNFSVFLQQHPDIQMVFSSHSGILTKDSQNHFSATECNYPLIKESFLL
ncbi:MAG: MBL fold metallo-hydrolase [Caldisericia bacterium]|nr:MBL fold metallo-hydrolase [Caldisericia bacterium]MDD4614892.1 MBL fold metallo-hydrolase [Caldisericia bacterium]